MFNLMKKVRSVFRRNQKSRFVKSLTVQVIEIQGINIEVNGHHLSGILLVINKL